MIQVAGHRSVVVWSLCGYLVVRLSVEGWLLEGLSTAASSALAVPLGVLFGLPAAVGLAVGVFVGDALRLAVSVETVLESLSVALIAAVGHTVWQTVDRPRRLTPRNPRWWVLFAGAAVVAATAGSAFFAWTAEGVGLAPFYFVFWSRWLALLAGTVIVAPPLVALVAWRRDGHSVSESRRDEPTPTGRGRLALVGVPFAWAGLGSLWSVGFQLRQRVPLGGFERFDLAVLYYWIHPTLLGRGGRRLQVVFGALMLTLLLIALQEAHSD